MPKDELSREVLVRVLEAIRGKFTGEETELVTRILAARCEEDISTLLSESLSTSMARDSAILPAHLKRRVTEAVARQRADFEERYPNVSRITVL